MGKPIIRSGKFTAGADLQCGENVVVNVAEEMAVGNRVVLPDNAYFEGRRIEIGDDFYGYSWGHPYWQSPGMGVDPAAWLEIGRGRIDEEDAILTVGSRCTFHDNRIDLARRVDIGDDVGLSPDVVIYTHGYWLSMLEGFPYSYCTVRIGSGVIAGFRSVFLPGAAVNAKCVIGAQSVVVGDLTERDAVYAGNPARYVRRIEKPSPERRRFLLDTLMKEYAQSCEYRGWRPFHRLEYPQVHIGGCTIDCEARMLTGGEDGYTDDLRWFLFTRGIRVYTKRPFKALGRIR